MAAPAVEARKARPPVRVSGVASVAVHGLLTVPRTAAVLGTSSHACWVLVEDDVVVVSTRDATRLPNGVEIAAAAADGVLANVRHGTNVDLGFGRVAFDNLTVGIGRWWDPRPALPVITPDQLRDAIDGTPASVATLESQRLEEALEAWSAEELAAAAKSLVGRGSGLTPEGDDYLAGAVAAIRVLGEAVGHTRGISMLERSAPLLARLADARTTTFSAALIRYALRGQVAEPAGRFLRAIAGRGNIEKTHAGLQNVGHSSGPALAAGIVLGAQALLDKERNHERSQT